MGSESRPTSKSLGSLESRLMGVLWETELHLSVQDVCHILGPKTHYKTVMTVLNRLVDKGLLNRRLNGRAYLYRPAVARETHLQAVANDLVQGYSIGHGNKALSYLEAALLNAQSPSDSKVRSAPFPRTDTAAQQPLTMPKLGYIAAAIGGVEILIWLLSRGSR